MARLLAKAWREKDKRLECFSSIENASTSSNNGNKKVHRARRGSMKTQSPILSIADGNDLSKRIKIFHASHNLQCRKNTTLLTHGRSFEQIHYQVLALLMQPKILQIAELPKEMVAPWRLIETDIDQNCKRFEMDLNQDHHHLDLRTLRSFDFKIRSTLDCNHKKWMILT